MIASPAGLKVTTCSSIGQRSRMRQLDLRQLRGVVAEHESCLGVIEHVRALLRRVRVIDRRHHRAGAKRSAVGQGPVGGREPEDRDAVSGLDAQADQALRDLGADRAERRVWDASPS